MSARELTVRTARPDETEDLAQLVNDAYGRTEAEGGWTSEDEILEGPRVRPADVEAMLAAEGSDLLVAELAEELVGCVHLQHLEPDASELGLLSVRPDLQDRGLGRRILAVGEAYAREEQGAERTVIKVIDVREELLAWYERRGYEPTGETRRFEPEGPQRSMVGPLSFAVLEKELDP